VPPIPSCDSAPQRKARPFSNENFWPLKGLSRLIQINALMDWPTYSFNGVIFALRSAMAASAVERGAKRPLGVWMSTALVVGNMIGSGVFLLPASLAGFGGSSIVGWLFTTVGALLLALVFARLGRAFPKIGGPYAYSRAGFGDVIGFQVAWGYWIAIWAGNAAIAIAFAGYLGHFWTAIADNPLLAALVAIAAVWLLTAINAAGIRPAGLVQLVTTVAKLLPLIGIAVVGIFFFDLSALSPFNPTGGSAFSAITSVAALTLWAFLGLESATIPADDVENPSRTIPRSTVIGTIVTAAVYILGTVAVMSVVPRDALTNSTAPFADAAAAMFGPWAGYAVAVGALFSTFGCLNGWILLQGQIPLAAARDGLFPAAFGRLSAGNAPVFGLVASSALVTILTALNYDARLVDVFNFLLLLATMTTLVPYVFTTMAELMLFVTDRGRFDGRRLGGPAVIALLAFIYSMWALYGAGAEVVLWGTLLLLAGLPVYVWMRWRKPRIAHGAAE
jgi:APA family basic amino acid/polyamine antiporter